jgi:hypothetical protein
MPEARERLESSSIRAVSQHVDIALPIQFDRRDDRRYFFGLIFTSLLELQSVKDADGNVIHQAPLPVWANMTRTGRASGSSSSFTAQGSFVIGGYTQPAGERKHLGALLVGVYQGCQLKFAGRVGTGFSEKLLKALSVQLDKIAVKDCPFDNLPATGRGLDPGLTIAEMKRCVWVQPSMICEVKFTEWTRDDRLRHPGLSRPP